MNQVALLLLVAAVGGELNAGDKPSIPSWAMHSFERAGLGARYEFSTHVTPSYQLADFDGDGKTDLAAVVTARTSGKVGVVFIRRSTGACQVAGAGNPLSGGGDDWSWLDAWSVQKRGRVEQGVGEGLPPKLRGDALLVEKSEAASAVIYWNGSSYSWYQQGD